MNDTFHIKTLHDLPLAAAKLAAKINQGDIVVLYGTMGAGKTTFVKEVCQCMNVVDTVNSPSYAIVNEYSTKNGQTIYHFDFYRIKNVIEAFDFGYEDYFYSGNTCFVEWPERVAEIMPDDIVAVNIQLQNDNTRIITF